MLTPALGKLTKEITEYVSPIRLGGQHLQFVNDQETPGRTFHSPVAFHALDKVVQQRQGLLFGAGYKTDVR
jgi:hypothetical protein